MNQQKLWLEELEGKTLTSVRPHHDNDTPVPQVSITFRDGSQYEVAVKDGAFFEGCLINTLRRAQPVVAVDLEWEDGLASIEVRARTFPLFMLLAQHDEWPFEITKVRGAR